MQPVELLSQCTKLRYKKPRVSGLYLIYCDINRHGYIGSSVNVYYRLARHHAMLNNNYHPNAHLQAAWNKYGKQAFQLLLLCQVPVNELIERETQAIDLLDKSLCFNQMKPQRGRELGFKMNEATKTKMSLSHRGKCPNKKLKFTEALVKQIRTEYDALPNKWGFNSRKARELNCSIPTIWGITSRKGRAWSYVV